MTDSININVQEVLTASFIPDPQKRFVGLPLGVNYIDGVDWELDREISYITVAGETATVHKGFIFDFASIPRILFWLYPPAGERGNPYGVAALVHDWLYCHRKIGGRPIVRKEADDLFCEIMCYVGCRWTLAYIMWLAVRIGGRMPWNSRKLEDIIP